MEQTHTVDPDGMETEPMTLEEKFKTALTELDLSPERRETAERVIEAIFGVHAAGTSRKPEEAIAKAAIGVVSEALADARQTVEKAHEVAS